MKRTLVVSINVFAFVSSFVSAELIRDGINMEFVTIGNAGNAADMRYNMDARPEGYGSVAYEYRIGKYEVTNSQWNIFVAAAGAPTGSDGGYDYSAEWIGDQQPTNKVSWYETAQFCNYLTSGDKSKGAYRFSGNNINPGSFLGIDRVAAQKAPYSNGTVYVIPTEDEWYKAAYYKLDSRGYSLYANGTNDVPSHIEACYDSPSPWTVGTGTQEQNATYDMMGNVWEWNEAIIFSNRGLRGGSFSDSSGFGGLILNAATRSHSYATIETYGIGFRVASIVPEPCSLTLLVLGGLALRYRKR